MTGQDEEVYKFVLTGKSLKAAIRKLRVAFPKKRQISFVSATFKVRPAVLEIGLPGAVVEAPCQSTNTFTAQIPFELFKQLAIDKYTDSDLIPFVFAEGRMTIGNISVNSPNIHITVDAQHEDHPAKTLAPAPQKEQPPQEAASKVSLGPDPLDSVIGFPLLGAYRHMRLYPDPTLAINASREFREGRCKVEEILTTADKLLRPLGLCRRDIEKLLDQRLGLSG